MGESIEEMKKACDEARCENLKFIAQSFKGIPVVADNNLKGFGYRIHVSKELHDALKEL